MWKSIFYFVKAAIPVMTILFSIVANAQQDITADKNNTRPEITRQFELPARITSFSALRSNGYNEIQWTARGEQDTRKFIVEYSNDGIYFQSAGEAMVTTGSYQLKHQTFDLTPLLYRIRIEGLNAKYTYSQSILLDGIEVTPVKIYPTIITGNTININADFPVERITVISGSGQQVHSQDVGGKSDYISISIPSLGKGMYWMTAWGRGWKTTSKFIIP